MAQLVQDNIRAETTLISEDLRALYNGYKDGLLSREQAETLANIAGKNLRAQAILLVERAVSRPVAGSDNE